ncbi:MAG: 5'-methylthioadenosine/S-adenosylhomocysteine nucleosidase [Bacilli bacterium]|jgi:adenosylhomocysteine nucleosidase
MKTIGLLVAVEIETVLQSDLKLLETIEVGKFKVYKYRLANSELIVIHSGAGQTLAAAATEILISLFKVELIINFGIAGALNEKLGLNKVGIVEKIVDYQYDLSQFDDREVGRHLKYPNVEIMTNSSLLKQALALEPQLVKVTCASGNKFVASTKEKQEIEEKFNCDIIEMEAASIQLIADMHAIPVLFIKGISDSLTGGVQQYEVMKEKAASSCFRLLKYFLESDTF